MNKSELVEALAASKGISFKKAEEVVNGIFDTMTQALVKGERIEIRGFGSFVVRDYKSYTGRNPKTGDLIEVKPKKLPFFKVGKELRERVGGADADAEK
jgi:integration host factor subunit beta